MSNLIVISIVGVLIVPCSSDILTTGRIDSIAISSRDHNLLVDDSFLKQLQLLFCETAIHFTVDKDHIKGYPYTTPAWTVVCFPRWFGNYHILCSM